MHNQLPFSLVDNDFLDCTAILLLLDFQTMASHQIHPLPFLKENIFYYLNLVYSYFLNIQLEVAELGNWPSLFRLAKGPSHKYCTFFHVI